MIKLLVVCGPTGTGKTSLGIQLAKQFNGEIISADSRQVYKGMDVGTGKLRSDDVTIWGYDLVGPQEEFSVAHFKQFAEAKIQNITARKRLPILVGGTGLYIKAILENLSSVSVPRNEALRGALKSLSAEVLFEKLKTLDPVRAEAMNDSDKKNPRRLVRAIEVAMNRKSTQEKLIVYDALIIGLTAAENVLENRLKRSITARLDNGFENEVIKLLHDKISITSPSLTATGYREMVAYLEGTISREELINQWFTSERQYIKRQLTWFRKQKNIHWFDIEGTQFINEVEQLVKTWDNIS